VKAVQYIASGCQSHAPLSCLHGLCDYLEGGWLERFESVPVFQRWPAGARYGPVDPWVARPEPSASDSTLLFALLFCRYGPPPPVFRPGLSRPLYQ
jgi:hypothetical protein